MLTAIALFILYFILVIWGPSGRSRARNNANTVTEHSHGAVVTNITSPNIASQPKKAFHDNATQKGPTGPPSGLPSGLPTNNGTTFTYGNVDNQLLNKYLNILSQDGKLFNDPLYALVIKNQDKLQPTKGQANKLTDMFRIMVNKLFIDKQGNVGDLDGSKLLQFFPYQKGANGIYELKNENGTRAERDQKRLEELQDKVDEEVAEGSDRNQFVNLESTVIGSVSDGEVVQPSISSSWVTASHANVTASHDNVTNRSHVNVTQDMRRTGASASASASRMSSIPSWVKPPNDDISFAGASASLSIPSWTLPSEANDLEFLQSWNKPPPPELEPIDIDDNAGQLYRQEINNDLPLIRNVALSDDRLGYFRKEIEAFQNSNTFVPQHIYNLFATEMTFDEIDRIVGHNCKQTYIDTLNHFLNEKFKEGGCIKPSVLNSKPKDPVFLRMYEASLCTRKTSNPNGKLQEFQKTDFDKFEYIYSLFKNETDLKEINQIVKTYVEYMDFPFDNSDQNKIRQWYALLLRHKLGENSKWYNEYAYLLTKGCKKLETKDVPPKPVDPLYKSKPKTDDEIAIKRIYKAIRCTKTKRLLRYFKPDEPKPQPPVENSYL